MTSSLLANVPFCQAQSGEDIAKGLLRALIESQLEKSRRKADARLSPPPPGRPGFGGPPAETQEILQLRPISALCLRSPPRW